MLRKRCDRLCHRQPSKRPFGYQTYSYYVGLGLDASLLDGVMQKKQTRLPLTSISSRPSMVHWSLSACAHCISLVFLQVHLLSDEESTEKPSAGMLVCVSGVASAPWHSLLHGNHSTCASAMVWFVGASIRLPWGVQYLLAQTWMWRFCNTWFSRILESSFHRISGYLRSN